MEQLLIKVFSEGWVIYWLFTIIVGWFIMKGIPFIINKFDEIIKKFEDNMKTLQESHRRDMETISQVFLTQIKESNQNHDKTHSRLLEIELLHKETVKKVEEIKLLINKK